MSGPLQRTTLSARLLAVLVTMTLVAVACGGDGDDTTAPGGGQDGEAPAEEGEPIVAAP